MKLKTYFFLIGLLLVSTLTSESVLANTHRFTEGYYEISETSLTFPMNHTNRYSVNSSYVEPRSSEIHPGIDSNGSSTNDVYPLADSAYVQEMGNSTSMGNYIVLRYTISGNYVYSIYMHLNNFATSISQGNTIASKSTSIGKVGNTGTSSGAHLHWEILKSYGSTSTRISVSPNYFTNWGSTSFSQDAPVFKNFNYNASTKTITIRAYDTDVGVKKSVSPRIIYKSSTSSSWSYATMNVVNATTYDYSYVLPYSSTTAVDVIIAGRRSTSEYWTYYPAKYTAMTNATSPVPSLTDSKITVYIP